MTDFSSRLVTASLCILVIALAAGGCGGSDADGAGQEGRGVRGQAVTITWETWTPLKTDAEGLLARFHRSHPEIDVKFRFLEYEDYIKDLRLKIAAGEGPDVFFGQAGAMIEEYAEFAEDLAPYAERTWGADWEERFYPLGLEQTEVRGKVAGLPWQLLTAGYIWYNVDLFERAGIDGPPETLDQLLDVAARLSAAGITPFVQGAAENWVNFDVFMAIAGQTAPGVVYAAEAGEASWTDPGLVEAMEIWKSLFDDGLMQDGALGISQYPDAAEKFYSGEAAMIMQGSWAMSGVASGPGREGLKDAYGLERLPLWLPFRFPDVDGDGEPAPLTSGPDAIAMINAASEHKDAAWALLEFLLSDPGQEYLAETLTMPAVEGYELDAAQVQEPAQAAVLDDQQADLEGAEYPRELEHAEIQEALGRALQRVASGQASADGALRAVQQASEQIER